MSVIMSSNRFKFVIIIFESSGENKKSTQYVCELGLDLISSNLEAHKMN